MNDKMKNGLLWALAAVITMGLVIYQRSTGPTYPVRGEVVIENEIVSYRLIRSFSGEDNAGIVIPVNDKRISGKITFKRYKSYDDWLTVDMVRKGGELTALLPHQPPAGKIEYKVSLFRDGEEFQLTEEPVIIRFTGAVPRPILIPHIFFMFFSILFGLRAGIEAVLNRKDIRYFAGVTTIFIFIGGLILGPIVQKYAFDAYWTGWPFGHDLTDNKTIVMFVFWLIAWWRLKKKPENRIWVYIAMLVMIAVYIIPHSAMGSEIDHREQEIEQVN
jgi:hypothetical protein